MTAEPHHFGLAPPCGRYSLRSKPEVIAEEFDLPEVPLFEPRFNIPPNQPAAVVRFDSNEGTRRLDLLPRSLVPFWTDDLSIGNRLINARSETVAEKPWRGIETIIWDGVTGTRIMW